MIAVEPGVGVVTPLAGAPHQIFAWDIFRGLDPLRKKLIARWWYPGGWIEPHDRDLLLLSSRSLVNRLATRSFIHLDRHLRQWSGKSSEVWPMPLGWQKRLRRHLQRHQLRALLVVFGELATAMAEELERLPVGVAVLIAGSDAQHADLDPDYEQLLRRVWKRADRCIFVSHFLMRQCIARGCPAEKCQVIYTGVKLPSRVAELNRGEKLRLACVGRLTEVKGHSYLLQALAQALRAHPQLHLTLIGDGELLEPLQREAAQLHIADHVEFTGELNSDSVLERLLNCDLYIQPSIRAANGQEEGLPRATLEAQACGLPAIAFDTGGMKEIIEQGKNGILAPERNSGALAEAIGLLAADAELRRQMGQEARRQMEQHFSPAEQNAQYQEAMRQLIAVGTARMGLDLPEAVPTASATASMERHS